MERQRTLNEPLLTWLQIRNLLLASIKVALTPILLYLRTTWGILKNPWVVIESVLYSPPQQSEAASQSWRSHLQTWWQSPRALKKQVWSEWFTPTPAKTFQNPWGYLGVTCLFFFFMTTEVDRVRYLLPQKLEKIEVDRLYKQAMVKDSALRWTTHKLTPEEKEVIAVEMQRLSDQKVIMDIAIRQSAIFVILLLVCLLLSKPLAKHYDLPYREVYWVGLYGLALALLLSIPAQLLTDVPASTFTVLGNILFVVGWLWFPVYYLLRYIGRAWPGVIPSWGLTGTLLTFYQTLVFITVVQVWLYLGVLGAHLLEDFHKYQLAKKLPQTAAALPVTPRNYQRQGRQQSQQLATAYALGVQESAVEEGGVAHEKA